MQNSGEFIEETGILCREIYGFKLVDGKPIIDFENHKQTIYNSDFNLSKEGDVAEVIGLRLEDSIEDSTNNPAYKRDYLMNISEYPTIDVNVSVNRGSASAFEKHLKLTECRTMEDLENYGNNIFFNAQTDE